MFYPDLVKLYYSELKLEKRPTKFEATIEIILTVPVHGVQFSKAKVTGNARKRKVRGTVAEQITQLIKEGFLDNVYEIRLQTSIRLWKWPPRRCE